MKNKTVWVVITICIVTLFVIISVLMPSIIQWLYFLGEGNICILSKSFNPSEILGFWGSSLGAIATLLLGAFALYQNLAFKEENDKSQEKLNSAVDKLANANRIIAEENSKIAETNSKLLSLEEKNQKIQLILAQKLIPFLELDKLEIGAIETCEAPSGNKFSISQNGDIRNNVRHGSNNSYKQITYDLEITQTTTFNHYCKLNFEMWLLHQTEAKISYVNILSIKLSNRSTEVSFNAQDLNEESGVVPDFLLSEWAVYRVSIVSSDDNFSIITNRDFKLTFELLITITTGITYKEIIIVNSQFESLSQYKNAKYTLEAV
jgi:hypothetical protein